MDRRRGGLGGLGLDRNARTRGRPNDSPRREPTRRTSRARSGRPARESHEPLRGRGRVERLALAGAPQNPAPVETSVSGRFLRPDGSPAAGAFVALMRMSEGIPRETIEEGETAEDGTFRLRGRPGACLLAGLAEGFLPVSGAGHADRANRRAPRGGHLPRRVPHPRSRPAPRNARPRGDARYWPSCAPRDPR
jgi:hypothetical protein